MQSDPTLPVGALPARPHTVRSRKPLRWFWGLFPLLLVMFLLGAAGIGLQLWAISARNSLEEGQWREAAGSYTAQVSATDWGFTPWVSNYNLGTALLSGGDIAGGRAALEEAWRTVPRATPDVDGRLQPFTYECKVRLNLAASWAEEDPAMAREWGEPCRLEEDTEETPQSSEPFAEETEEERERREELEQRNEEQQERERERSESQNPQTGNPRW